MDEADDQAAYADGIGLSSPRSARSRIVCRVDEAPAVNRMSGAVPGNTRTAAREDVNEMPNGSAASAKTVAKIGGPTVLPLNSVESATRSKHGEVENHGPVESARCVACSLFVEQTSSNRSREYDVNHVVTPSHEDGKGRRLV